MDGLNDFLTELSGLLWGWPMIILLLGTTVRKDPDATGDVSQFGSLATALAATIGTGNIVGVATAIALGGPGAVLWCWLTA